MILQKQNIKEHNPNWPQSSDHSYKKLIIGESGYRKTNALLNLTSFQSYIDKTNLYAKDPYKVKYQF